MRLSELARLAGAKMIAGDDREIVHVMNDSRLSLSNSVFVCLKGAHNDACRFTDEAVRHGAVAVCLESEPAVMIPGISYMTVPDARAAQAVLAGAVYGINSPCLFKTAVTGTNGKTSLVNICADIFSRMGDKSYCSGTLGVAIPGFDEQLSGNTTFDPAVYGRIASLCKIRGAGCLFSEVSSQGAALGRVSGIHFDLGVFLNLSPEHLDFHKDMESYYQSKKAIFRQCGRALVNVTGEYGARLARELEKEGEKPVTFAMERKADYRICSVGHSGCGASFVLSGPDGSFEYSVPLFGRHNVENAAAAVIVALIRGHGQESIREALSVASQIPGRLEMVSARGGRRVFIDYAHTPEALRAVLAAVRDTGTRPVTVVFGCGGERDTSKRAAMGRIASLMAEKVIVTSDNPRTEPPNRIIAQILEGIEGSGFIAVPDRARAIGMALDDSAMNDVIIAGKGHEDYMIIGTERIRFSDRETVLAWEAQNTPDVIAEAAGLSA